MKPHSNIFPNITIEVLKVFLLSSLHIYSEKYLARKVKLLINIFAENGHSKTVLE